MTEQDATPIQTRTLTDVGEYITNLANEAQDLGVRLATAEKARDEAQEALDVVRSSRAAYERDVVEFKARVAKAIKDAADYNGWDTDAAKSLVEDDLMLDWPSDRREIKITIEVSIDAEFTGDGDVDDYEVSTSDIESAVERAVERELSVAWNVTSSFVSADADVTEAD